MTARTKIVLSVGAVFIAMLAIYYGVIYPAGGGDEPLASTDPLATDPVDPRGSDELMALGQPGVDPSRETAEDGEGRWTASRPLDFDPLESLDATTPASADDAFAASLPGPASAESDVTVMTPRTGGDVRPAIGGSWPRSTVPTVEPPAVETPAETEPTTYVIKRRDTMSSIAQEWLGDASLWPRIAQANPRLDPMRMQIGQKIVLPPRDGGAMTPAPSASGGGGGERIHVVRDGENLSEVALTYYGDDTKWQRIYRANRTKIGTDPDQLEVGMRLVIPGA